MGFDDGARPANEIVLAHVAEEVGGEAGTSGVEALDSGLVLAIMIAASTTERWSTWS